MGMLRGVGTGYILSDDGDGDTAGESDFTVIRIIGLERCSVGQEGRRKENPGLVSMDDGNTNTEYRSHILFTSGSSGKPKAVQIPGRAILHLVTD